MSTKPLTIKDIRARFNRELPKYIGLQNERGQWLVPMNPPAENSKKRMERIEAFFKKDSTADGIYFFIEKDNIGTNVPEVVTPVAKGDVRNLPAIAELPKTTIQMTPTKDVWDLKTALDKETQIISLTMQNQFLTDENANLRRRIKDLEESVPEDDEDEKSEGKDLVDGLKSLLETVTPVIDKHFELKERDLKLRENGAGSRTALAARSTAREVVLTPDKRDDGLMPANDPGYEEYFAAVINGGTEDEVEYECRYLEGVAPELYKELAAKYEIEEDDGSETT